MTLIYFPQGLTFQNDFGQTYLINKFIDFFGEYECCHENCSDTKFYSHEQIQKFIENSQVK